MARCVGLYLIPAHRRLRQERHSEFKACLGYIADVCLENKNKVFKGSFSRLGK